jgi:hypothetical protein
LDQLLEELENVIEYLYCLEIRKAMMKWSEIVDPIITVINIELDQGTKNDIMSLLNIVNATIENKDYILMADLLKYELLPILQHQ